MLSERQQIKDWIAFHIGKFTSKMISDDTGIGIKTVARRLSEMHNAKLIKVIDTDKGRKIWSKVRAEVKSLAKMLKEKPVAEVAKELGISEEAVYQRIRKMDTWPEIAKKTAAPREIKPEEQAILNVMATGKEYTAGQILDIIQGDRFERARIIRMGRAGLLNVNRRNRRCYYALNHEEHEEDTKEKKGEQ